ncbi:oligopeptide transporter 5-like [Tripterygium wilfordii]|uniref:Oligopeptide transporter 5-like n=1 Tax=Tripterygium wilfordii TaxID=458696 RepID=A0A7J7CJ47_TRIWF|nr:uncharacterized protein LOC119980692 [Tripterygium wilfordii]KAF5734093.1 oligopeptide transporter 5-like [Tripterygium wilfordii]
MATPTSLLLPDQQQQQAGEIGSNSEAVLPGSSSGSSGSIGSFFAVMSVLVVLAIVSCVVGRMCREGKIEYSMSRLDSIRYRGCFGWVRRKWRRCVDGHGHDVEVGAKVVDFGGKGKNVQAKDDEVEFPRD